MKIYVASSWRNEHQQFVVNFLRDRGHEVYDFKHPTKGNAGFHWSEIDSNWKNWTTQQYRDALRHEYAQFGFNRDFNAMKAADACVLVLPCGRSAHLEAGWMKGAGKKVFAYIPLSCAIEPELMYGMLDYVADDVNEIAQLLSKTPENDNSATANVTGEKQGDAAKLREALELARFYMSRAPEAESRTYVKNGQCEMLFLADVLRTVDAALATPARNCDMFNSGDVKKDANDALVAMLDKMKSDGNFGYRGTAEYLLSPITPCNAGGDEI